MTTFAPPEVQPLPFSPLIVLGAGRSGTNALRDMLSSLPQITTWPCDEINPIWRHGNVLWPNDEIPPERATPAVIRSIRKAFYRQWKRSGRPAYILEKTCANTLRVPFIDRVLPQARYIHIVRDGRPVIPSAQKRWRGELEVQTVPYFLKKARFIPLTDVPYFGYFFVRNRFSMLLGKTKRMSMWGPRFADVESYQDKPLVEICAAQWIACVESSDNALARIDRTRVFQVNYESMTEDPVGTLTQILDFIDPDANVITRDKEKIAQAASIIRSSPNKNSSKSMPDVSGAVRERITAVLNRHGYE
jgi:hypothetical protein